MLITRGFVGPNIRNLANALTCKEKNLFGMQCSRFSDMSYSTEFIRSVFSRVANKYDLMNDLMSLGIHRIWKDIFAKEAISGFEHLNGEILKGAILAQPIDEDKTTIRILDLAGGTGDVAFRLVQFANDLQVLDNENRCVHVPKKATPKVLVLDPSEEMIGVGKSKCANLGLCDYIDWQVGCAEEMKLASDTFDLVTVAFGVRNFSDVDAGLAQCYRVLKPGGKILILEFSKCQSNLLSALYDCWSNVAIPFLGEAVAGNGGAYKYLVDSIRKFPNQHDFAKRMQAAGFDLVSHYNLTRGIVAVHSGFKRTR
ncbi:bifunctional UbiE-COQ5 methyltransferase [Babesia duncani]|uniref:2-methoxy-6-polyprenyl-1,4-benzoquinol methylase, mitochondrial n=1 Tax=Babesia duncani TaxID=323732 RepID=A0AAD9UNY5_9APIC|nr:bifunctional UbiE-COQ5 methyltransferase [Babesia duncani]